MQNTPAQSSKQPESQDQQPEDLIRTGYTVESVGENEFVVPNVMRQLPMELAWMFKPDVSKALKMSGGVCFHLHSDPKSA
jgi:hypothetical protein